MGSTFYPLSQQIRDCIAKHGRAWAQWHYCEKKRGPRLSAFEWSILAR
jgi:hypothetical protein